MYLGSFLILNCTCSMTSVKNTCQHNICRTGLFFHFPFCFNGTVSRSVIVPSKERFWVSIHFFWLEMTLSCNCLFALSSACTFISGSFQFNMSTGSTLAVDTTDLLLVEPSYSIGWYKGVPRFLSRAESQLIEQLQGWHVVQLE